MSLNERLLVACLLAACPSLNAAVSCPAVIEVAESATAASPWKSAPAKQQRKFERISVYNGTAGGKEFDLAPDDQKQVGARITQTWRLKGYRSMPMFLRCRYHDTSVVLYADLPPEIAACTLSFSVDEKAAIVGSSVMNCR